MWHIAPGKPAHTVWKAIGEIPTALPPLNETSRYPTRWL